MDCFLPVRSFSDGIVPGSKPGNIFNRRRVAPPLMVVMLVVQVGRVCMAVDQRFVPVPMAVRLAAWIVGTMRVLVVLVVDVQMLVLHRLVDVGVLVPLTQVQPNTDGH